MLGPQRIQSSKNFGFIQHNPLLQKYLPPTHGGCVTGHEGLRAPLRPKTCSRRRGKQKRSRRATIDRFFERVEITLAARKIQLEAQIAKAKKRTTNSVKKRNFSYWTSCSTGVAILKKQLDEVLCLQAEIAGAGSTLERQLLRDRIIADRTARYSPLDPINPSVMKPGDTVQAMVPFMEGKCRKPEKAGAGMPSFLDFEFG